MASLQEAFGCSFSETPFEVIDEHFRIDEDDVESQIEVVPQKIEVSKEGCSCGCKTDQEYTNILLMIAIGLLLFIILEKRLK